MRWKGRALAERAVRGGAASRVNSQAAGMQVLIPGALRSYTGATHVEAVGTTLGGLLDDMDRRFPGVRFRMVDEQDRLRPHMRVFIDGRATFDLGHALHAGSEVAIVQALSGG